METFKPLKTPEPGDLIHEYQFISDCENAIRALDLFLEKSSMVSGDKL